MDERFKKAAACATLVSFGVGYSFSAGKECGKYEMCAPMVAEMFHIEFPDPAPLQVPSEVRAINTSTSTGSVVGPTWLTFKV